MPDGYNENNLTAFIKQSLTNLNREALKTIEFPRVATVQIISNIFRQRPKELFFPLAQQCDVGILVCLPLANGSSTKIHATARCAPTALPLAQAQLMICKALRFCWLKSLQIR